ncbi:tRNA (5-methylaminomethyl-2-thiouridine)(34)-methyltransferase MnmD [Rhodohalobacter mucosus]|uniref:MnmC-like methyltransferase domain-containing protein n=1 Tax=Rhodohalobacter mucosus TaxID=2079485 RepID=A0A316TNB1_9BACT|nr:tRNA (5-methylaminomethyl-2-thiouridine)(34)-methyltransferase MnmD [Rhodohalobacter mucosus]PWN06087.1 hypothetical protein DDZ15_09530 [Rhodohalobacter mucosus]
MQTSEEHHSVHITLTRDGSTTLYSDRFGQHYHNPNGAVAESRHVFFETADVPGLLGKRDHLTVFETGFGSGLNLILMLDYLKESESSCLVDYVSIEAYPISPRKAVELNFGKELANLEPNRVLQDFFKNVKHGWNRFSPGNRLKLHLFNGYFGAFESGFPRQKADLFFHDPFSPEVNPDLWTKEVFEKLLSIAAQDAFLITYCAASSARAAMASAGWHVARAPGALGKREMTIASPSPSQLSHFKRVNEERLKKRYDAGDFKR